MPIELSPGRCWRLRPAIEKYVQNDQLWVFAYGSLMWNPGFDVQQERAAVLEGYHRALCIRSWRYRGCQQHPGLVFGLDQGGVCHGRVLAAQPQEQAAVMDYLWEREVVNEVYQPQILPVQTPAGVVPALAFVADSCGPQYISGLSQNEMLDVVLSARGQRGPNRDYVLNTHDCLRRHDITDLNLDALCQLILAKSDSTLSH